MILRNFIIAFQAEIVYNNDCSAKAEQSDMRLWRNWQTRKTKDLVFPRHAGSSPVNRTSETL